MHRCPQSVSIFLRRDFWCQKSSCWLRRQAMQQPLFSNGQTGEHLALIPVTSKPCSSRVCCSPFGSPFLSVIFCSSPQYCRLGLLMGIIVSFCFHCFPPLDLFLSKAHNASSSRDAWPEDWFKINNAQHSRCAFSKIDMAFFTCLSNCVRSHQASPFAPG